MEDAPKQNNETKEKISFRLLYAEDTESLRKVTVRQLEGMGAIVEAVENGQLLLEKLETGEYDIILTDKNMPVMTGIEALQKIRANEKTKNIPVIVLTSEAGMSIEKAVEEYNGVHIVKGTRMKDVYLKMVSLIEGKK